VRLAARHKLYERRYVVGAVGSVNRVRPRSIRLASSAQSCTV
jgi:hypothetical protein